MTSSTFIQPIVGTFIPSFPHMSSPQKAEKLPSRLIEYDGFLLFAGACNRCPRDLKPWIVQFCEQKSHNWFVPVSLEYALDFFNYYGFDAYVPNVAFAKEMICDRHSRLWSFLSDDDVCAVHDQAKLLFGLLHSRWICTTPGLCMMRRKVFKKQRYGVCPRLCCKEAPLLPMGLVPVPNRHSAKLFCPRCADIYNPPEKKRVDGAFFGPAFPATFLVNFPEKDYRYNYRKYPFKIFGFNIYRDNKSRMLAPHETNNHKKETEVIENQMKKKVE